MGTYKKITVLLFVLLVLNGCASMSYEDACRKDTIIAYRAFVKEYPHSSLAKEAKKKIERLHFHNAKRIDSIDAYKNFIRNYPGSEYADQVQKEILYLEAQKAEQEAERLKQEYEELSRSALIQDYVNFIQKNTSGPYYDLASLYIDEYRIFVKKIVLDNFLRPERGKMPVVIIKREYQAKKGDDQDKERASRVYKTIYSTTHELFEKQGFYITDLDGNNDVAFEIEIMVEKLYCYYYPLTSNLNSPKKLLDGGRYLSGNIKAVLISGDVFQIPLKKRFPCLQYYSSEWNSRFKEVDKMIPELITQLAFAVHKARLNKSK